MKHLLVLFLALSACFASQARTVADFFGDTAADKVFPGLSSVARLDMVDYFRSGMTNPTKNGFDGFSRITTLSDSSLSIDYASGMTLSLTLLPGKQPVLMLIETMALPQLDSRISFYDQQWQPLKSSPLKTPLLEQWLTPEGRKKRAEVETAIPFLLSTATFDNASQCLTLTTTLPSYWGADAPKELSLLVPQLVYKWNGKRFTAL